MAGGDRKGTFKVEFLKEVEKEAQEKWENLKIFEVDAPQEGEGTTGKIFPRLLTKDETTLYRMVTVCCLIFMFPYNCKVLLIFTKSLNIQGIQELILIRDRHIFKSSLQSYPLLVTFYEVKIYWETV